ncbi:MAG: hypothetical protein FWD88_08030, partial [Treponema sp.]|nr:hypothetical protein [Treponema sp.]
MAWTEKPLWECWDDVTVTIYGNGTTISMPLHEFDSMVDEGGWENLREDFPDVALWLERRDHLHPSPWNE